MAGICSDECEVCESADDDRVSTDDALVFGTRAGKNAGSVTDEGVVTDGDSTSEAKGLLLDRSGCGVEFVEVIKGEHSFTEDDAGPDGDVL